MRPRFLLLFSLCSELLCPLVSVGANSDGDGTAIVETGTSRGRATVARRDYAVGDIIMREAPALVWDGSDLDYLGQYTTATKAVKSEIENLAHLPLNSPSRRVLGLRDRAVGLVEYLSSQPGAPDMTVDEVHKLLLIANTNLHHYFGRAPERAEEASAHLHADQVALFPKAAKVNHACAPNAMYTTQTPDGKIEYTAIREVKVGDEITFSYLSEDGETMSRDQRAELLAESDIVCECARCARPDVWRGLRCPKGECDGIAFEHVSMADRSARWQCVACGEIPSKDMTERLQQEAAVRDSIEAFTDKCRRLDAEMPDPAELERIFDDALLALAPTHSLLCRGQLLLSKLFSSYAARLEQGQDMAGKPRSVGSAGECHLRAAAADVRALLQSEAVAAGQHDCAWDEARRLYARCSPGGEEKDWDQQEAGELGAVEPLFRCAKMAFDAGASLCRVRAEERDARVSAVVGRYLSVLRLRYGDDDPDVLEIAGAVAGACAA